MPASEVIDNDFSKRKELFYAWYMDNFIIFARTRWHALRAIKRLLNALTREGYETHPDKTQLSRLEKGVDWLGLWYAEKSIHISPRAKQNHRDRCTRFYEQA
ncbi:reverse transcriptase domain-containing protein [Serratia quinivorans]